MNVPRHDLHIYQRPKLDTTSASIPKRVSKFIRKLPILNYQHRISCMGGFDTAAGDVVLHSISEALIFMEAHLACAIKIIVDNPAEPCWEGFINRMSFSIGGGTYSLSLDEMGNRITVTYTEQSTVTVTVIGTTVNANSTASQALYGIKQDNMEFGYVRTATSTAMAALRDTLIANRAFPKASLRPGNGKFTIHMELLGFYHTLRWESYNSGATTSVIAISTMITGTLLPALANGKTFFDNTDFKDIATNAITYPAQQRAGGTFWDILQQMAEIGDGANGFVVGITPTRFDTRERRLYYKQINTAIEYTLNMSKGLYFQTVYRKRVPPWKVKPDRGARVEDWLVGYGLPGDDPRQCYIYDVSYDANNQRCTFNSQDDTTLEGVFESKRAFKRHGKKLGAAIRYSEA